MGSKNLEAFFLVISGVIKISPEEEEKGKERTSVALFIFLYLLFKNFERSLPIKTIESSYLLPKIEFLIFSKLRLLKKTGTKELFLRVELKKTFLL